MKHASIAIAIAAFVVACSSAKDGTNASAPATAKPSGTTAAETSDETAGKAIESAPAKKDEKWPAAAWTRDASVDASRFKPLEDGFPGTYSRLVVSGGEVVFERYQAPYGKDSVIHVNSCTKTVIAMLMSKTPDWARYVFEREVAGPPGQSFLYNSGGSQVVSTLVNVKGGSESGLGTSSQDRGHGQAGVRLPEELSSRPMPRRRASDAKRTPPTPARLRSS